MTLEAYRLTPVGSWFSRWQALNQGESTLADIKSLFRLLP